jgi:O-antigen ligase
MNRLVSQNGSFWSGEVTFALLSTTALALCFAGALAVEGGNNYVLALLPLVAIIAVCIVSFEVAFVLLIVTLFLDIHVSLFSSAVWFSILFALSFLIRYREIEWRELSNPMDVPILIYGLCIIPSFVNAVFPFLSLLSLFNVIAFLVVLYITVLAVQTHDDARKLMGVYLLMVLLNTFDVIRTAVAGDKRVFGFSGVMFVDYSALAVCITAAIGVVSKGKVRFIFVALSTLIAIALVLTRTRNTWFSTLITLAFLGAYLMFNPDVVGLSRRQAFAAIAAIYLVIIGSGALFVLSNRGIEKRATEISTQSGPVIDERGFVENSLVSRLLIWDTAFNAFRAHPIVGIGVYAFPNSSKYYYRIPRILYERYVANASPHQTYLAVLAETGIVGAIGYFIFMLTALRIAYGAIRRVSGERAKKYAFVGAIALTYCSVSMVFTDAWLWGQGIILFGLVLGIVIANRRIGSIVPQNG